MNWYHFLLDRRATGMSNTWAWCQQFCTSRWCHSSSLIQCIHLMAVFSSTSLLHTLESQVSLCHKQPLRPWTRFWMVSWFSLIFLLSFVVEKIECYLVLHCNSGYVKYMPTDISRVLKDIKKSAGWKTRQVHIFGFMIPVKGIPGYWIKLGLMYSHWKNIKTGDV